MQNSIILENISPDQLFAKIEEIVSQAIDKRLLPKTPQTYITKKEAAAKLRLSLPTLGRLISDGTIKVYRIGRSVLFKSDEIELALTEISNHKYKRN